MYRHVRACSRARYTAAIADCIGPGFAPFWAICRNSCRRDEMSSFIAASILRTCCAAMIGLRDLSVWYAAQWYRKSNQLRCAYWEIHCGTDECHQSGILKSLRTSRSASSLVMPASMSSRSLGLLKISSNNRRSCLAARHTLKNCITRCRTLCIWRSWIKTQDSPQLDI
jgi:hypothetical protein